MKRRLFFLFPDEVHARHAIDNLFDGAGIEAPHIHAVAGDERRLRRLPQTTSAQRHSTGEVVEETLWNTNLGLFFAALFGLIWSLVRRSFGWSLFLLGTMAGTFLAGYSFTQRIPHARLSQFRSALRRGEIVVMVDVPPERVAKVEEYMQKRHPEAVAGGAGWAGEPFGL